MIKDKIDSINQYVREKGRKHLFILISIQMVFLITTSIIFVQIENQEKQKENNEDQQKNQYENLYKWLILILFCLSQLYYAWHSIIRKNLLELFAYLIISTCTTIASTLRYFYISIDDNISHSTPVKVVCYVYIIFSICIQIIGYLSYNYFLEAFRDEIFHKIGASLREQQKFKWFTYFQCLLQVYAQLTILIFITFFFFFDNAIEGKKQLYIISDVIAIIVVICDFFIGYFGVKKRIVKLVYLYFFIVFFICLAENVKLVLFLEYYDYDISKINLDWATFSIISIIFLSSIIVLIFNFFYGIKCLKIRLLDIKTFDAQERTENHFLSQYDYN